MKCPTDGTTLSMSERSGIEIDYCPECRGVWLDRGELDKLLDRAAGQLPAATTASTYEREREERRQHHERRYADPQRYASSPPPYRKKRKESWLSEIFD